MEKARTYFPPRQKGTSCRGGMYIYMYDDLHSAVYIGKAAGHIIHEGPLHIYVHIAASPVARLYREAPNITILIRHPERGNIHMVGPNRVAPPERSADSGEVGGIGIISPRDL